MASRPLICSPCPLWVSEVQDQMALVKADKVWARNMPQPQAYSELRQFFLHAGSYTHMVICPGDLVVTSEAFELLRQEIERRSHPKNRHYPVLTGICNITDTDKRWCVSTTINSNRWLTDEDLEKGIRVHQTWPVMQVEQEGFACTWIRSDIVAQIEFHPAYNNPNGSFNDGFSIDLYKKGVPIYAHTAARMKHLALPVKLRGEPSIKFEKAPDDV